ncbi:MAG: glycosyltransferase [Verrucomicrobiota bacterium]
MSFTHQPGSDPKLHLIRIQRWTPAPGSASLGEVKISVIIPAFNEERLLVPTLAHINAARSAFAARGFASELIVCDNNSTDRTAEMARAAGARVVFEPVNQIARARNTGAAVASGDWLLFIDADSHPTAELFAAVVEQIQSGKCLAGGSTIRLEGNHQLANFVTGVWNWQSRSRRWLAGSFIFCEAAAFRKLGGFNPELFVGEELDLTTRLQGLARESGREIVILHRHPLLTSARKVRLYSTWEHLRFLVRVATNREATFRDREACYAWYDGRR